MTADPAAPFHSVARAASIRRDPAGAPETPGFVATVIAPHTTAPASARVATGAVAASARASLAATVPGAEDLPARPRVGARAASSVALG